MSSNPQVNKEGKSGENSDKPNDKASWQEINWQSSPKASTAEARPSIANERISDTDFRSKKDGAFSRHNFPKSSKTKWYHKITLRNIVHVVRQQFRIWTTFPMVPSASIYFDEDDRYGTTGEPVRSEGTFDDPLTSDHVDVEVEANYDKATLEIFEIMMKYRKEAKAAKDNYHTMKVDLNKFPEWTDVIVDRLRTTFQVFDISGDGLVDFDELSTILAEFGDTSEEGVRRKYFDEVNDGSGSLDFMNFITMIYNLTVKTPKEDAAQDLANSYRGIDRNMARIRSLDVVQQLQAGLF